ncbi:MAG TPA: MFS transporter [Noviherbaspirillum sp.]|nr:MFS transporter [Noviherbaspirillum sp.]
MIAKTEKTTVLLLASAQALFQTAAVMVMTISALVGFALAPNKALATLPIALMTLSTAAMMIPAALLMRRYGRKAGFITGAVFGSIAGLLAASAVVAGSFWVFVAANMLVGAYQAFAQYYRFAAADAASADFKSRAVSWVIAGGVVAAVAGPNIARFTEGIGPAPFAASFLAMTALGLAAIAIISRLSLAREAAADSAGVAERPLREIARQPVFLTAVAISAVGFAVMIMVMTATPLAMRHHGHDTGSAATVIQWHVLGMFVPSFFTGNLIRRFGVLRIASAGALIIIAHIGIALSGAAFLHFLSGLILLGIGWNFLFIAGTTLLTDAYRPSERFKAQATHDFVMFGAVATASFSSGALLDAFGWTAVNLAALPFLVLILVAIAGYGIASRRAPLAHRSNAR